MNKKKNTTRCFFTFLLASLTILPAAKAVEAKPLCSKTSLAARKACGNEIRDDYYIAKGNCYNIRGLSQRLACRADALSELREARGDCRDQYEAREEVCDLIGQGPYHPTVDPADFLDPGAIAAAPNPYWPLVPGTTYVYQGGGETITVTVTGETKVIMGVTCVVVRDVVEFGGEVIEDTYDWYGQDISGNVWYFGEIAREYEGGELVGIDGSWKAGVDGAKPGIIMAAAPAVGDVYRQEFLLGDAEDMGEVLDLAGTAAVSAPGASCSGDCLVTADFTPLEPDVMEHKYYSPGFGLILEVDPATGESIELVQVLP